MAAFTYFLTYFGRSLFFFYLPGVWNGGMRDVILEKKIWYQHALVCGFPFIFETLMITFFFFFNFRAAKGDLVPFALLHLLHCLLSKSASVSGAAYTEIRALAAAKSVKLQNFFSQYKKPICQVRVSIGLDYGT